MRRFGLCVLIGGAVLGCATPRPVLYPNDELRRAGREQAERDIDQCLALAQEDVGSGRGRSGERVAARTATGAATGAAVGAAASRSAARGAAGGAAGAATHAVLGSVLNPRRNQPDPVFRNYVDRCLRERGYDVIGWRAK
ncbi:MAG TPA: hypothetical protein VFT98_13465 [Myxococcota bacterium]|nr:hypothetical protein [Myxococcota bacterium]